MPQARHNSLPLDAHFSGDLLQSYKPNPAMYTRACDLLGFDKAARQRGEVALCASHIDDLRAAAKQGVSLSCAGALPLARAVWCCRPRDSVPLLQGRASTALALTHLDWPRTGQTLSLIHI